MGLVTRWIAILSLKKSFTVNVSIGSDQQIVQTGIYRCIRHPSYLGSLLSFLGLSVAFNNWLTALLIFPPILAAFIYRMRIEEEALMTSFGDAYGSYMQKTSRLIPGIF